MFERQFGFAPGLVVRAHQACRAGSMGRMGRQAFGFCCRSVVPGLLIALALLAHPPASSAASDSPTATPIAVAPVSAAAGDGTSDPSPGKTPDRSTDPFREREDRLAVMLDRARVSAGVLPLARSPSLDRAAVAHAADMAAQGYMEHEAPDGSTPGSRAAQEGYDTTPGGAWMVVETISAMGDDADAPLGWWLSDGLHRRVVLRSYWRELGIGYAPGGPYGRFWVALFGCRPGVLPPVLLDGVLTVPDEGCGHTQAAFGSTQSVRVAESSAAVQAVDWEPYTAQRPWAVGRPAVVDMRDATGHQLEARATDPTGSPAPAP